jgi:hypothetical protein
MMSYPACSAPPVIGIAGIRDRHQPESAIGITGLGDRHQSESLIVFTGLRRLPSLHVFLVLNVLLDDG